MGGGRWMPGWLGRRQKLMVVAVAVLCDPESWLGSRAVAAIERTDAYRSKRAEFLWGVDPKELNKRNDIKVLIWVPGCPASVVETLLNSQKVDWLHSWFVGVDTLGPLLRKMDASFPVTNAKHAYSQSLAEWCIAVMMHFEKSFERIVTNSNTGQWDVFTMGELRHKTVGFVGYGAIAQTIAKIAKTSFEMNIIALRRHDKPSPFADEIFTSDSQDRLEVFRKSDFVISTLPETAETISSIGLKEFSCMKPEAVFISIGRGTVVDEDALAEVLKSRAIKGAALDVFHAEPLPESSPLWGKALITAHNADRVPSHAVEAAHVFVRNFDLYLEGARKPSEFQTPVDKRLGY